MLIIKTNSAEETIALGGKISRVLKPDSVIALSGNLGSGKTTLVKGIAEGLGIDRKNVISPSFTLIREYQSKRMNLFHCDLYRLDDLQQISFLGLDDYFSREGVLVIEWAKKAEGLLPDDHLNIDISPVSESKRKFKFSAKGKTYKKMINRIKEL
ncbi:MAG: tRNA (adenosine(37)-N6)-threonylcarbamoyltransferase complex ATPase subunit type 1 TsaE [PVC group bacterium]|nr:tRNA (adenosine(37)-N6)-threonylcarbamoyltransferase complex ATPase subunit type 1 TsaE [PVC group bacterium]